MGKINLLAPFPGVKDAITILTLLEDKKKLKEVLGVIKTLEDERQALNESIEVYGKASKMDVLLRNAGQKDQEAAAALSEAKEGAEKIQKDAKTWADDLCSKLVDREDAVKTGEKSLAEGEAQFKADVVRWDRGMKESNKKVAEREQTTLRLLGEAQKLKERHDIALDSMKAGVAAA